MGGLDEEMSKASGQVIVDTAADARRALAAVFGDATAELAGILSDNVKLWRFRNLLRIKDKVEDITARRGLTSNHLRALPMSDALRIAHTASDEDQPEVQVLWARLIANAMSKEHGGVERAFIDLLKSLSPNEVLFLELLWKLQPVRNAQATQKMYVDAVSGLEEGDEARIWKDSDENRRQVTLQNLQRLRCISPPSPGVEPFLTKTDYIETEVGMRRFDSLDVRRVERQFEKMTQYLREAVGGDPISLIGVRQPEWLMFELTSLGRALMEACRDDLDISRYAEEYAQSLDDR